MPGDVWTTIKDNKKSAKKPSKSNLSILVIMRIPGLRLIHFWSQQRHGLSYLFCSIYSICFASVLIVYCLGWQVTFSLSLSTAYRQLWSYSSIKGRINVIYALMACTVYSIYMLADFSIILKVPPWNWKILWRDTCDLDFPYLFILIWSTD